MQIRYILHGNDPFILSVPEVTLWLHLYTGCIYIQWPSVSFINSLFIPLSSLIKMLSTWSPLYSIVTMFLYSSFLSIYLLLLSKNRHFLVIQEPIVSWCGHSCSVSFQSFVLCHFNLVTAPVRITKKLPQRSPPQPITTPFENVPKLHGGCQEEIQYYSWNGKRYKNKRQTHKKCGYHHGIREWLNTLSYIKWNNNLLY